MEADSSDTSATQVTRPLGIWVASIWAGLFAGIVPLGLVLFFYFGPAQGHSYMTGMHLVMSVLLSGGVVASAVATWKGVPRARLLLAALVVTHYLLLAYQNYQLAMAGIEVRGSITVPWIRVFRSIITAGIIAAYLLLSARVKAFSQARSNPA